MIQDKGLYTSPSYKLCYSDIQHLLCIPVYSSVALQYIPLNRYKKVTLLYPCIVNKDHKAMGHMG